MQRTTTRTTMLAVFLLLTALAGPAAAQSTAAVDSVPAINPGPLALPGTQDADTVRTNLWLVEALMAEIAASTAHLLPAPPTAVRLIAEGDLPEDDLFQTAVFRVLDGMGYEMFLPESMDDGAGEIVYAFRVVAVELEYPDVGRTLGIWRRWVQRDLMVAVHVDISEADSGRLLLSDRIERAFGDRVPSGDFDDVNSRAYLFTSADTEESGWKRRLEEIVVLGTLAGLVAVYFANTGN